MMTAMQPPSSNPNSCTCDPSQSERLCHAGSVRKCAKLNGGIVCCTTTTQFHTLLFIFKTCISHLFFSPHSTDLGQDHAMSLHMTTNGCDQSLDCCSCSQSSDCNDDCKWVRSSCSPYCGLNFVCCLLIMILLPISKTMLNAPTKLPTFKHFGLHPQAPSLLLKFLVIETVDLTKPGGITSLCLL